MHSILCDFYTSITEELLHKALDVAFHFTIEITTDQRMIIKHTKKTTLNSNNMPWRKIGSGFNLTVTEKLGRRRDFLAGKTGPTVPTYPS